MTELKRRFSYLESVFSCRDVLLYLALASAKGLCTTDARTLNLYSMQQGFKYLGVLITQKYIRRLRVRFNPEIVTIAIFKTLDLTT